MARGPRTVYDRVVHYESAMDSMALTPKTANKLPSMKVKFGEATSHQKTLEDAAKALSVTEVTAIPPQQLPPYFAAIKRWDKIIRRAGGISPGVTLEIQGQKNGYVFQGLDSQFLIDMGAWLGLLLV